MDKTDDDSPLIGRELTMICRAVSSGWDIPDATRQSVVRRLNDVIDDPASSKREVNRAATALSNIDRLRMQAIAAARNIAEKSAPVVIIQQAKQDDPVRKMIETASESQLAVIAELLRNQNDESEPATGGESSPKP